MKRKEKGTYGYIGHTKRFIVCKMLVLVGIALAIFILGLLLNKNSKANIFTIIAILFVLPWAKALVEYIVLFPYKTPNKQRFSEVKSYVPEEMKLYSDVVITSTEKVMNLDFIVVGDGCVIGLIGKEGQDLSYIQTYLSKGIKNWSDGYGVKIYKDYKLFLKSLPSIKNKQLAEEEVIAVNGYIHSLMV